MRQTAGSSPLSGGRSPGPGPPGELPAIAQRRAFDQLGLRVGGDAIVIIGDTPADIDCGRAIGARPIAVATGRYSVQELADHNPVAVFEDLSDTDAVMKAIDDA